MGCCGRRCWGLFRVGGGCDRRARRASSAFNVVEN